MHSTSRESTILPAPPLRRGTKPMARVKVTLNRLLLEESHKARFLQASTGEIHGDRDRASAEREVPPPRQLHAPAHLLYEGKRAADVKEKKRRGCYKAASDLKSSGTILQVSGLGDMYMQNELDSGYMYVRPNRGQRQRV